MCNIVILKKVIIHVRCNDAVKLRPIPQGKKGHWGRQRSSLNRAITKMTLILCQHFQTKLTQFTCPKSCTPMNAINNVTANLGIFLQSQLQLEEWRLSFYLLCKLGLCSCEHRSKITISVCVSSSHCH